VEIGREVSTMEGILYELLTVEFAVAFTGLLLLIAAAAGVILAGMAEEEREGARLLWAEWPIPVTEPVAPERKVRLAA
jgi:Na+/H+ antiporter NhaD/arsenite permease-like protein